LRALEKSIAAWFPAVTPPAPAVRHRCCIFEDLRRTEPNSRIGVNRVMRCPGIAKLGKLAIDIFGTGDQDMRRLLAFVASLALFGTALAQERSITVACDISTEQSGFRLSLAASLRLREWRQGGGGRHRAGARHRTARRCDVVFVHDKPPN